MPYSSTDSRNHRYAFSLILAGVDGVGAELENALYEAGCDDALLGSRGGVVFLDFDREAPSFFAAVVSAVADVGGAGLGLRVDRVEPDDLVTAAEIARRTERTRESIRLLMEGDRGPGGFPAPVANLTRRSPIWRWTDVAAWFDEWEGVEGSGRYGEAAELAMINAALALQRHAADVEMLNRLWKASQSRYELRLREVCRARPNW